MNKNLKILLVDDDKDFGHVLTRGLSKFDYSIKQFTLPRQIEEWMDATDPEVFDCIILDYYLCSAMSGLDVLQMLRAKGVSTALLMMSSNEDPKLVSEVIDNGANLYITKDFKQPMSHIDSKIKMAISIAKMSNNIKKIFSGEGA